MRGTPIDNLFPGDTIHVQVGCDHIVAGKFLRLDVAPGLWLLVVAEEPGGMVCEIPTEGIESIARFQRADRGEDLSEGDRVIGRLRVGDAKVVR